MANNIYEGDPRLYLSPDGLYLDFRGGQPIMDAGLENTIIIPLITRNKAKYSQKSWVGNLVFPNRAVHIGSDFEEGLEQPITISSLEDVKQRAEKALQFMIDSGLASEIIVEVANPVGYRTEISILVRPPNLPEFELLLVKNGINWVVQRKDPTYTRFN
jgi:phage gp46-like protein